MVNKKTLVLFGASGKTGQEVLKQALDQKFKIKAITRNTETNLPAIPNVEWIPCNILHPQEVKKAVQGSDNVIIVFGPLPPYKDIFCAEATNNIVKAMEEFNIKRLICQTGAMIGEYPKNRTLPFKLFSWMYKINNPQGQIDRVNQEEVIKKSSLDWTIIKPPKLTDNQIRTELKSGPNIIVGLMSSISRRSLGKFIIQELLSPQFLHQTVFIKE